MTRVLHLIVVSIIALTSVGCVASEQDDARAFHDAGVPAVEGEVRLQSGDRIRVTVFGEDKLTGDYEIDGGGSISVPLTGTIRAAGLTTAALESALVANLRRKYLRDPKVTVSMASFRPFYILGEVEKPGEYPFKTGLNIWRAIAVAGGQTYRASSSTILIQRPGEAQMKEYDLSHDMVVGPGDLIRVPDRWF